ncbi:MAG: hypothetical protein R6W95_11415, partial [Desulfosarcina sp.]
SDKGGTPSALGRRVREPAQRSVRDLLQKATTSVSIQKRGILVEIKACEKFYHRHIDDIPRIKFKA